MRDPKLTFLIRCAYGAVWLALIWLMVRYVLVWLLPFLIALALAALAAMYVGFCAFGVAGMVLCPMALLFVKQLHDSGWLRLWK